MFKALALYPGEAPDARIFGDEVAGIVTAVGTEVAHVKPGDRVGSPHLVSPPTRSREPGTHSGESFLRSGGRLHDCVACP